MTMTESTLITCTRIFHTQVIKMRFFFKKSCISLSSFICSFLYHIKVYLLEIYTFSAFYDDFIMSWSQKLSAFVFNPSKDQFTFLKTLMQFAK